MATTATQRAYRAPCPGCGAPVDFLSAQSTHAICGYCQSMVLRQGETLSRLGKMAEVFDDFSPLQLQSSGKWNNKAFTLVGRLQYQYAEGNWTEWYAVLDDGSSAFLSEDNGAYVFSTPWDTAQELPGAAQFSVGSSLRIKDQNFVVTSSATVHLRSAQGELPRLPPPGQPFAMVELRSQGTQRIGRDEGSVLSIDYSSIPPGVFVGRGVLLDDLQLTGLREDSTKTESARQFNCPSCGAQLSALLPDSKSMTCSACHALIDLSQGLGGELRHAVQDEPVQALIALGSIGKLQGVDWQVVGFQHRMGTDPADPDEQFGWEEYLLYNRQRGFTFLVDSTEGWSVVKPATGAPVLSSDGRSASYLGTSYYLKESYSAETSYVAGEFYWQVTRGQKTANRDFVAGKNLLSLEQSAHELTWSLGSQIDSDSVAQAFGLEDKKALLQRSDASPTGLAKGKGIGTIIILVLVLLLVLFLMSRCSACDPATQNCNSSSGTARSSGGSYGGYTSGGGHK